jgi:hypothetical protein
MKLDHYIKILLIVLTISLLMNGLNPWVTPPAADAKETTGISGGKKDSDCSSAKMNSAKSLEEVKDVKRLLGYIESSVNDIKLTVSSIDRKVNDMSLFKPVDRK